MSDEKSPLALPETKGLGPEGMQALTAYMASPSLEAFRRLTHAVADHESNVLTDLFYSLVTDLRSTKARHLAEALALEGRFLEALHVLQRWSTRNTVDVEASRTAAILAVKTTRLLLAEKIADSIVEEGGLESTRHTLSAMIALRSGSQHRFQEMLDRLIELKPADPLAASVAVELSIRMDDRTALMRVVRAFGAKKCLDGLGGRQTMRAQRLLRLAFIDLLGQRPLGTG
jgi:hypothetical protein